MPHFKEIQILLPLVGKNKFCDVVLNDIDERVSLVFVEDSPFPSILSPRKFSTYDEDNDEDQLNCAALSGGGWWFGQCGSPQDSWSNLNGEYVAPGNSVDDDYHGMRWAVGGGLARARTSEMKIYRFQPTGIKKFLVTLSLHLKTTGLEQQTKLQFCQNFRVTCKPFDH